MSRKKYAFIIVMGVLILGLFSFNFLKTILLKPTFIADWNFIQSVGGLKLGEVKKIDAKKWKIPIDCNVSGLKEVTIKPTKMNSAIVVKEVLYQVKNRDIYLSLSVGSSSTTAESSICPDLVLENIPAREYNVFYQHEEENHSLGKVLLAE